MTNVASAILALLAFVALALLQSNVPWANEDGGDGTARTWTETRSGSSFFFSYSQTRGWYDGGWDHSDQNAVNQLQMAAPLLLAGTVVLLVGCFLSFGGDGPSGAITTLVGGILAAGATLLYYLAIEDLYDSDLTWQPGLTIAVVATVLGLVGGIVGMAAGNRRRTVG